MADAQADPIGPEPSQQKAEEQYETFKRWIQADQGHSSEWRKEAKDAFDFVAGHGQWTATERQALEKNMRVPVTFNQVLTFIKAIAGIEINGRHQIEYLPRVTEPGPVKKNELLTSFSEALDDESDAADAESTAFQDCAKTGMGWVEAAMSYDDDPDGCYKETRINPLEMGWDREARERNLTDARRIWRAKANIPIGRARQMFPNIKDPADLHCSWLDLDTNQDALKPKEDRLLREENASEFDPNAVVTIVQVQWWEFEEFHRVADPHTGKELHLPVQQFAQYKSIIESRGGDMAQIRNLKQVRKVYKQAFLGRVVLSIGDCPRPDGYTLVCLTGEPDENKGTWYGITRVLKDPQKWTNKWASQTMHILNATAKGGIVAEEDAFSDQRQAEESYAQPEAITWAAKGAISGQKLMAKPGAGNAAGYQEMMTIAMNMMRSTTGINLELIGLADRNQPGVLEQQRKQAGMTILATLFDSLRRFRKEIGRTRLHYIQNYLADGRMVRIVGQEGMKYLPLLKQDVSGKYDVIVSDAPTSPNQKQETWATIQQIVPAFKDMLTPEVVMVLLEYSPLPSRLIEALRSLMQKPDPAKQAQQEIGQASATAKIERDRAAAYKDRRAGDASIASAIVELVGAGVDAATAAREAAIINAMPQTNSVGPAPPQMPQQQMPAPPGGPA